MHALARTAALAVLLAAALLPATATAPAAAAPPANDSFTAPAQFEGYSSRNGFPIERQATAELAEATPDAGVERCLGSTSMARTVWYLIPSSPNGRELTVEAVGRTTDAIDLAAFVQIGPPRAPRSPNACAGRGVFGDDATEDRTVALRVRVPAFHQVLVQVGRRGTAGPPEEERALVTLDEVALPPYGAPVGDRAGRPTPTITRPRPAKVRLGGATTSAEDPAVPSCPAVAGVWRRAKPRKPGAYTVTAVGATVGELSVFSGARPRARTLLGCVDREGPGALVLPVRVSTRRPVWIRLGTDRPRPGSRASLSFRPGARGDAESGGGCLSSASPQVRGGPARSTRLAARHNRVRSFELSLRAFRGPVCAASVQLRGPGGAVYARGDVAAIRGRPALVLLPRTRRLRKGLYRLRVEATRLGGVRRAVPSTVRFRLR